MMMIIIIETLSRRSNNISCRRTTKASWRRSTETFLGVSFETYLRCRWDVQRDVVTMSLRRLVAEWVFTHETFVKRKMGKPQPTQGPGPRPEVHRSSYKGLFPACISPGLHLVEWTRHNVDLSYFVAAHMVHSSGCRLQLTSQPGRLKIFSALAFANPL